MQVRYQDNISEIFFRFKNISKISNNYKENIIIITFFFMRP